MMDEPYFHAKHDGDQVETRGSHSCLLGHQIDCGQNGKPDGIFAQWAWDGTQLTVSNDRYGFHPLFYYCRDGEIGVSPSIPRLIREGAPTELDDAGLAVFLRLGFFIGEDTPFKHIRALPPDALLEWDGSLRLLSGGYAPGKPQPAISRDKAIDTYIALFRQSIQRRLPPDGHFALPLSGGRDSRHILFELLHNGCRPERCVTARHYPPRSNEDARVAAALTHELDLPHVVLEQKESWFKAEYRKNLITNLCADEHAWYMVAADYLAENFQVVYDGIAGDVLSAGLFITPELLKLFESGQSADIADELLQDQNEGTLKSLLTPGMHARFGRERAVSHLQSEIEKHLGAPNPVGSFFFWNRTRREIALVPYGLLGSLPKVFSPYLDHDLYDFLVSLPAAMLADHTFHSDTLRRAYPQYAQIPYEDKKAAPADTFDCNARFGRELAWRLLPGMPSRMMRNGFLFPRLLASLLSRRFSASTIWHTPLALYLHQLESLSQQK